MIGYKLIFLPDIEHVEHNFQVVILFVLDTYNIIIMTSS